MKNFLFLIFPILLFSCSSGNSLFNNKSLHEAYGDKIKNAGLSNTALGKQWFSAAAEALSQSQLIELPYKEQGYFPAANPTAMGLMFSVKQGEKVKIELKTLPVSSFVIYADLWRKNGDVDPTYIASLDTTTNILEYEVKDDDRLILRLQPELLKNGSYTLTITTNPSLAFPVAGDKARIGSYWGADRDGGSRSHEGVDIFAPFRTPVIATANGVVTRVNTNNLGGKVVWFRPSSASYTLYYAHLDEQLATTGQSVKTGDTLGLIGNTGNAKTTPPHLHFGIYTSSGAVNPLPFIKKNREKPADITASAENLFEAYRLNTSIRINDSVIKKSTLVYPIAAFGNNYRVKFPNGLLTIVSSTRVQPAKSVLQSIKLKEESFIYDLPDTTAAVKAVVSGNINVEALAYYDQYTFIKGPNNTTGWIIL